MTASNFNRKPTSPLTLKKRFRIPIRNQLSQQQPNRHSYLTKGSKSLAKFDEAKKDYMPTLLDKNSD
jgi:hypothetical protein